MPNPSEANEFFDKYVSPNFVEWRENSIDERLAMNLALSLDSLVDHYWHSVAVSFPGKVFHQKKLRAFRIELSKKYPDIGLIQDVADAHKHLILDRTSRSLTGAEQTSLKSVGYGEAYGMCYGGGELIMISLDNGDSRPFLLVAESVHEYWRSLFKSQDQE